MKQIPKELLCKYYLRAYTLESPFYKEMNDELRNGKIDNYIEFIKIIYKGIKLNAFNNYSFNNLYRSICLLKTEVNKIKQLINKKEGDSNIIISKSFFSFTEDKSLALKFIEESINDKYISVLFILKNKNQNLNEYTYVNTQNISIFSMEKEILFLPFSNFEIIKISEIKHNNQTIIQIDLNYIGFKDKSSIIKKFLKESEESKEFVKKLDIPSTINKIKKFTGIEIDKHKLEIVQLNNKEKQKERKEIILNISNNLKQCKINPKEYTESLSTMGSNLNDLIIYEIFHEPQKFIQISDSLNEDEESSIFIQKILAKQLQDNNITTVIKKEKNESNLSSTLLQLIISGDIYKKVINIEYNYDKEREAEILYDENEKKKFINSKKLQLSKILNIPINQIYFGNLREGTNSADVSTSINENCEELIKKIKDNDKEISKIKCESLIKACILDPSMFDPKGDRFSGWGIGQKRGPPKYLKDYIPPLKFKGYGLKVSKVYDNGNDTWLSMDNIEGEWYIAYHGTGGNEIVNKIMNEGFKAGEGQVYKNADNINPLTKNIMEKCGVGVYCTPQIDEAESYSGGVEFNGKSYKLVFMCRVNPYKVRFAKGSNDYWIVSGDQIGSQSSKKYDDEIRPYRILLREY